MNKHDKLLINLKIHLPEMIKISNEISGHWGMEDGIYRYYHQSNKLYPLQEYTIKIVETFQSCLDKDEKLNDMFLEIIEKGINIKFDDSHNKYWAKHTRPILEAFFHAQYFLNMAIKYARELDRAPTILPSGWAAILYLYNLRYED